MDIVIMPRGAGKTHKLIMLSSERWHYIVCMDQKEARRISHEAMKMKVEIPFPLTFDEFNKKQYSPRGIKGFIFDNADMYLQSLTSVGISCVSLTS